MVVLAASICTKGGKAVISRQFRDMTRARIESLLAAFPKLIPAGTQHTTVETSDVRYVYQPLEDLYIVLITNKASNILQDIDTLHLFARVVSDLCRSAEEREILRNSFEVLGAFDEVVSMGYRENVTLLQVRSVLEMESHEEKIQEIIARNKEAEAKEELKRRAKQLEMQRREQQRRTGGGGGGVGGMYGGLGSGMSGYSAVPQRSYDAPDPVPARTASPAQSAARAPAFKGSGMKLGSKKVTQDKLLDALGGEMVSVEDISAPTTPAPATPEPGAQNRGVTLPSDAESVHIVIKEHISATLAHEGGLDSMELVGDMNLHISDPDVARIKLQLGSSSSDFGAELQLKQHPQVGKFGNGAQDRIVALKNPDRPFPVNQALAVLKWRYVGKDESLIPLSINCWPAPANDGTCEVNIEYELENKNITLTDVVISIPLAPGAYPNVSSHSGDWSVNSATNALDWSIPLISADESSGSLEFTATGDETSFFPVQIAFVGSSSLAGISVTGVTLVEGGSETPFSQQVSLITKDYMVV